MTTEEIKRALQCCVGINGGCDDCPCRHTYYEEDNCRQIMIDAHSAIGELEERIAIMQESMGALEKRCNALDALEQRCKALEKQDEPKMVEIDRKMDSGMHLAHCPNCWKFINNIHHYKYCGYCGQAVKWDD